MACIRPDGTLTAPAVALLKILDTPKKPEEIAQLLNRPLYLVRSNLREMVGGGWIDEKAGTYVITGKGKEKV